MAFPRENINSPGAQSVPRIVSYEADGNCYLNITNRCSLSCRFCPKARGQWHMQGHDLYLTAEPDAEEIIKGVGDPRAYREVVFCGLGEPTMRFYTMLQASRILRERGASIRVNTDGLVNVRMGRDVTADLEENIDTLCVSLNGHDARSYNDYCRPVYPQAFEAVVDFINKVSVFVPKVIVVTVAGRKGINVEACKKIARDNGADFMAIDQDCLCHSWAMQ